MKNISNLAEARFQFGRKKPLIWLDRFLLLGRILHLIISNRHSHLPQSSSSSTQTLYLIIYILPSEAFRPAKISLFHCPTLFPPHFSPSAYTSTSKTANHLPQSHPPPTPLPHKRQVICLKSTNQNATKTPNSPCDHTAIGIFWTIAAEVIPWPLAFPTLDKSVTMHKNCERSMDISGSICTFAFVKSVTKHKKCEYGNTASDTSQQDYSPPR